MYLLLIHLEVIFFKDCFYDESNYKVLMIHPFLFKAHETLKHLKEFKMFNIFSGTKKN